MLTEQKLPYPSNLPLSKRAAALIEAGRKQFDDTVCFGFVPSNYELVWSILDGLKRGRFVEWGSGFGIVTGLAEILGFDATGIEIEPELVEKSKTLLDAFELQASIETGDYLQSHIRAEIYFVYCWPGKMMATEARFAEVAGAGDKLLICEGQSDIRCRVTGGLRK